MYTADPGVQSQQAFEKQIVKIIRAEYLLYLPQEYRQDITRWPLVLFLHGAGERGDDVERVKTHGPPKLVTQGKQFPFILVSPQCPAGASWSPETLGALLDEVTETYRVDEDRVYVTGISMGGYGTWNLAAAFPERFAAIAPICGGGSPAAARRLKHLPTWVFHGAMDTIVPLRESEVMVEAMESAGGNVRFTVYPEADHDSWTQTYENPEFYEWLLKQRRPART